MDRGFSRKRLNSSVKGRTSIFSSTKKRWRRYTIPHTGLFTGLAGKTEKNKNWENKNSFNFSSNFFQFFRIKKSFFLESHSCRIPSDFLHIFLKFSSHFIQIWASSPSPCQALKKKQNILVHNGFKIWLIFCENSDSLFWNLLNPFSPLKRYCSCSPSKHFF